MILKDFIPTIPLFQDLEQKNYEDLANIVLSRKYKKGEMIFSEYDTADGFYVAVSGRVKIFKSSPEGKEQILHIFGKGEPFGEIAVFTGKNFPASAQTLENCETIFFPKNAFIDLIKKDPALSLNMLSVLSMRLKRFSTLIEDLSLKDIPKITISIGVSQIEEGDELHDVIARADKALYTAKMLGRNCVKSTKDIAL